MQDYFGQRESFIVGKPKFIKIAGKFAGTVKRIHTGDKISFLTYENSGKLKTRKFFAWGDKNIIDVVS